MKVFMIRGVHSHGVLIDDACYALVRGYTWHMVDGYAKHNYRNAQRRMIHLPMANLIWEYFNGPLKEGQIVDHINGIRHDNQIRNLRPANRRENAQNRPKKREGRLLGKYTGVSCKGNKYTAALTHNGRRSFLGTFNTPEQARDAYEARVCTINIMYKNY